MKKIFCLMLVIILQLTCLLSGCNKANVPATKQENVIKEIVEDKNFNNTGLPIVNEPITLKVAGQKRDSIKKSFDELEIFKRVQEKTNVNIEWDVTPKSSWGEKKNLILASGDWPDVFYGNYLLLDEEIIKFASDGVFVPLENLIDEYGVNINKVFEEYPEFKRYITAPDNHIYSLPTINANQSPAPSAQFINKKWLEELDLEVPKTTDEFHDVLKAFKSRCKDDELPFTFRYGDNIQGLQGMFGSFGLVDNNNKLTVKDDKVLFTAMQQEYKDAVQYFNELFNEELVDVESFSQSVPVFKSKIMNQKVGVVNMWSLSWLFGSSFKNTDYILMEPLKGPNGYQGYTSKPASELCGKGSFLITKTCENPEVAMRWADYMCEPEISFQFSEGLIGVTYEKLEDGKLKALPDPEGMSHDEFRHQDVPGANSFHMITGSFLKNVIPSNAKAEKESYDKIYEQYKANTLLPPFLINSEDAQRVAEIRADLDAYVKEKTSKWMLEGGIENDWDKYIDKLKQMGVEELVSIYQKRYDENNALK